MNSAQETLVLCQFLNQGMMEIVILLLTQLFQKNIEQAESDNYGKKNIFNFLKVK